MKIVKKFQPKIVVFTSVKNRCMLYGRVFVMFYITDHSKAELLIWFSVFILVSCSVLFSPDI